MACWTRRAGERRFRAGALAAGPEPGLVGAAVAARPAVALVGSYELLMMVIRGSLAAPDGVSGSADIPGPLSEQAAELFADELAAHRVPSVRAIHAQLHVGQSRGAASVLAGRHCFAS